MNRDRRQSFYLALLFSTIFAALEAFLVWGFSQTMAVLTVFVLLYGATAGGFAVLRPRFTTAVVGGDDKKEQSMLVFGVLTAARGLVVVLSGFIANAQLNPSAAVTSGYGAGKWKSVVVYTGAMMVAASLGAASKLLPGQRGKVVTRADGEVGSEMAGGRPA